ncbi:hypothetical protein ACVWWN_005203 [Mycobacterium sp. URHB0021]
MNAGHLAGADGYPGLAVMCFYATFRHGNGTPDSTRRPDTDGPIPNCLIGALHERASLSPMRIGTPMSMEEPFHTHWPTSTRGSSAAPSPSADDARQRATAANRAAPATPEAVASTIDALARTR